MKEIGKGNFSSEKKMVASNFEDFENMKNSNLSKESGLCTVNGEERRSLINSGKSNSLLTFLRLLFYSTTLKPQAANINYCDRKYSGSSDDEDSSNFKSSGYHSLTDSLEIEDSYIKVSRFSGKNLHSQ